MAGRCKAATSAAISAGEGCWKLPSLASEGGTKNGCGGIVVFAEFMVASLPGAYHISQQLHHVKQMERMPFEPRVRYGFEHESMDAKIR